LLHSGDCSTQHKKFKFLPHRAFFGKAVLAILNLAHLLLPSRQADTHAKSKELNSFPQQIGARQMAGVFAHLLPVVQKRSPAAARLLSR
jgi:hypothetical protein